MCRLHIALWLSTLVASTIPQAGAQSNDGRAPSIAERDAVAPPAPQRPASADSPSAVTAVGEAETAGDLSRGAIDASQDAASVTENQPAVGQVYVDQTLEAEGFDDEVAGDEREEDDVIGRRFSSQEYRLFHESSSDDFSSLEQGLALRWSRETIGFGTLTLDAEGRHESQDGFTDDNNGVRFTFGQDGFVLGDNWQADSTLGDLRATTNRDISSSFRFTLPSSIVRGASTRIYSDSGEYRLTAGKVGRLAGVATLGFEDTGGSLWGLGYARRVTDSWSVGLQGWTLSDDDEIADHSSVAGLVRYEDPGRIGELELRALHDTRGNLGIWLDGDTRVERWRHRYGVFRFEPGLLWTDVNIVNDRQGAYWRGDRRAFRRTWGLGLDFEQTNIESDPNVAGINSGRAFSSLSWRVRRRTTVGSFANAELRRPGSGLDSDAAHEYSFTGFLNHEFDLGTTRVQAEFDRVRVGSDRTFGYGFTWDQEWKQGLVDRLDTTLGWSRINGSGGGSDEYRIGASVRHDVTSALGLAASASYSMTNGGALDSDAGNVNFSAIWRISRDWQADLSATINENVADPVDADELRRTDRRVLFTLRHSRARGRPARVFGQASDGSGTGTIVGRVFYDENRDGKWSPTERGAAGILVYLDRRGARQTDSEGRFEVAPVFVGEHGVTIAVEDLPLPWGLEDETPVTVRVRLRDTAEVDFPLVRLDE